MSNSQHTEIKDLGEFGLIELLTRNFKLTNSSSIKGVGDDCAVIDNGDKQTLISTDMFVHQVHFDLMYSPVKHIGYKVITAAISDIYAMNGMAEQVVVSLAISNQFSVELLSELYSGMITACENYKVDFVGGDTTTIPQGMVINTTAIGSAGKDDIVFRKGASKNELLCVSGDLGGAYVGLLILEREKRIFVQNPEIQPKLEGYDYVLRRQLKPEARKDIIETLKESGIKPTSMIDVSDGLSSEILHLSKHSECGCKLFEDKIPIDSNTYNTALELKIDPITCALNGGEDYELLFTIKQEDYKKIESHPDFSVIGHICESDYGCKMISKSGIEHQLVAQGWESFKKE